MGLFALLHPHETMHTSLRYWKPWGLYVRRKALKISLLEASHSTEFITGDQCVVNTRATPGHPPESLELYFPVSPRYAVLVDVDNASPGQCRIQVDESTVAAYNRLIETSSHEQIFASRQGLLAPADPSHRR